MKIKLKELLDLKYGKRQSDVEDRNGSIPIYGTGGVFGKANEALYEHSSILIGRKGTINKPFWVEEPFWCVDTMFYSIIDASKVIPKYLFYNLSNIDFINYNEGTTIPSLRIDTLNEIDIHLHTKEEQQHIVDILGSIDEKIELLTTENEKIEKYSNYLFDVFSENAIHKIKLKDVVCFANTGADAIQKAPIVDYDTGIRCARVGDFSNDRPIYEWGFCNIVPELFSQYQLKQNDILITRTATLGLAKLIDKDEQAVYNNGLIRIKINNKIACSKYIYRVLKSKDFIDYIAGIEGASSTRPNMKINYLLEYKFNILSMAEQLKFNACYSVLRNKQLHNQNSIFKLNELKQLYLKKFFG